MESNAFLIIEKHTTNGRRRVQEQENRMAGRDKSIYCGTVRNKTKLIRKNEIVQEKMIQKNMGNVFSRSLETIENRDIGL